MLNRYAHNANARITKAAPDPTADRRARMMKLATHLDQNRAEFARQLETATGAEADALRARIERNRAFATGVAEELALLDAEQPPATDAADTVSGYMAARYGHNAGGGK